MKKWGIILGELYIEAFLVLVEKDKALTEIKTNLTARQLPDPTPKYWICYLSPLKSHTCCGRYKNKPFTKVCHSHFNGAVFPPYIWHYIHLPI